MGYLRQFRFVHFSWTREPAVAWFSFSPLQTQMALSFKPLVVDKFLFANEKEITIMTVCNHETYGITVSLTDTLLTSRRGSGYNMSFVWDRTHVGLSHIFKVSFWITYLKKTRPRTTVRNSDVQVCVVWEYNF